MWTFSLTLKIYFNDNDRSFHLPSLYCINDYINHDLDSGRTDGMFSWCIWFWNYDITFMCCDIILHSWRWFCGYSLFSLNRWFCTDIILLCFDSIYPDRPVLSQYHYHYTLKYTAILMIGMIWSSLNTWTNDIDPWRTDCILFPIDLLD